MTHKKTPDSPKTGVMLLNMGGPDQLKSVRPFLYNLFSDPDIIKLPCSFLMQKPLAALIVALRGKEAEHNYAALGGGSPQLPITRDQAAALQGALAAKGYDFPVYIAMRYWHPFTDEALDAVEADGIERLIVVTLYPHFSYTTTGSSINELKRRLKARNLQHIQLSVVAGYCKEDDYLASLAACMEEGFSHVAWPCERDAVQVLFSAHSLPVKHVERTKDPYPKLIQDCAKAVMKRFFPNNPWDLAYQSKVGKMPWLGPQTDGVLTYYAGLHQDNILVVPISFVSDHVETLIEIDRDYIGLAQELGIKHITRAPVMNTRPHYINTLVRLIEAKVTQMTESSRSPSAPVGAT